MRHLTIACSFFFVAFVIFASVDTHAQTLAGSQGPISTIIKGDGSAKSDVSGYFDPSGYQMTNGPNGEPRFLGADQPHWEAVVIVGTAALL